LKRRFASRALSLFIALHGGASWAQEPVHCAAADGGSPALAALDARERTRFVRGVMRDQAHRARVWSWTWGATGTGLAAGSFVLAGLAKTPDDRVDPLVGGATSLLIPAAMLIQPLRVMGDDERLAREVPATSVSEPPEDTCRRLARMEALFIASADDEAFGVGIVAQALAVGVNGAVALILGLGYHHWTGALLNGGGGFVLSEFQLYTQPTGAIDALAQYRRGSLDAAALVTPNIGWRIAPLVFAENRGLVIGATF
jgi:hypothetical protein